jgi:hypothetical protein
VLEHLGLVALDASPADLEELSRNPLVERIETDEWLDVALDRSAGLVGAPAAWAAGLTGAGSVVAVIDSGIDTSHPALVGRVVAEACFSDRSCPGGQSSASGPGTAAPCTIGGSCQHGTHVAGIVAGTDARYRGIAPDVGLLSVQVFSRTDDPAECGAAPVPCPRARTSDVLAALDHVYALRAQLPLVAVNMSLSSDAASPGCNNSILAGAIDRLKGADIATVVATGNSGATNGLGVPACISSTVSVAATYADRDEVWQGSNVSPELDLLAPGVGIVSPAPGGGFSPTTGTSAAAPHVSGAWALAVQRLGTRHVDTILANLRASGRPLSHSGLTTPLLDLNELAGGLPVASAGFSAVRTTESSCGQCETVAGDFDGDGRGDLFWYEPGGTSRLWSGLGNGTYREDLTRLTDGVRFQQVAGDFDGDGRDDLLWYPRGGGGTWLWRSIGGGRFVEQPSFAIGGGLVPLAGDFDGSGVDDVFFYGPGTTPSTISLGQAGGSFASIQVGLIGAGFQPQAGDFDGNRLTDLFWWAPNGQDWVWQAVGGGNFVGGVGASVEYDFVPAVGDYRGDGRSDILWVSLTRSVSWIWHASGGMGFEGTPLTVPGELGTNAVATDHDGDRRSDVYWYGPGAQRDALWLSR